MLAKLKELGLTAYESKVYVGLLDYGRMTAKEISQKSGVPPTAVYPNLKTLLDKGFIQEYKADSYVYEAVSPRLAFASYLAKRQRELKNLGEEIIEEAQTRHRSKQIVKDKPVLSLSRGLEASRKIYMYQLGHAKKTFFIMGWRFYKPKKKYTHLRDYKAAIKRGVDIRLILTGKHEKDLDLVQAYADAGIKIKYSPLENFSIMIRDGQASKITLKDKNYPDRFNIKILDQSLCAALQTYFLGEWEKAHPISVLTSLKTARDTKK